MSLLPSVPVSHQQPKKQLRHLQQKSRSHQQPLKQQKLLQQQVRVNQSV